MKLKNILFALSILFAFTACSSDSNGEGGEPTPPVKGSANLSVNVISKALSATDDPNELAGEANINNLTAFIFDIDGTELLGFHQEEVETDTEYTLSDIYISRAERVKVVAIANAPLDALSKVTTYAGLEALLADLSAQKQDNLTMSTQVITTTSELKLQDNNYIGFHNGEHTNLDNIDNIYLTRIPARLKVKQIRTNFTRPALINRTVRIDEVYFENAKTKSRYFSASDWGKVEYEAAGIYGNTQPAEITELYIENDEPITDLEYFTYVMENTNVEQPTSVVVKATLVGNGFPEETKTFRSPINAKGSEHQYIKRNYIYTANLTFGDTSFDGTEEFLDIQVEVVKWGQVNHEPEF